MANQEKKPQQETSTIS